MKDFNLENIKERQLYTIPDQFFEDLQANVLEKVSDVEKIVPLHAPKKNKKLWLLSAAASLAIIAGSVVILESNDEIPSIQYSQNSKEVDIQAKDEVNSSLDTNKKGVISVESSTQSSTIKTIAQTLPHQEIAALDIKKVKPGIEITKTGTTPKIINNEAKNLVKKVQPEAQIDLLLSSFSEEELQMLANNADSDVYLDLYN